jgi:hypothetical protein
MMMSNYIWIYLWINISWKETSNIAIGLLLIKLIELEFIHHTFDTTFSDYNNVGIEKKNQIVYYYARVNCFLIH